MPTALKKMHDREQGFTLIELLIVVLIIGILAAIAIPVYLGIQNQSYKAAVRADVNLSVKRAQVALTEGKSVADVKGDPTSYTQKSVKGEVLYVAASPSGGSANDFGISGVLDASASPASPINYAYNYDSVTGRFTESDSALPFGSAAPSIIITTASLPDGVKDATYSKTMVANAVNPTGNTTWSMSGLPAGLNFDAGTGTIAGTPTVTGSSTVSVTATNGSTTNTRSYTLVVNALPAISTASVSNGVVGTTYSQQLVASGSPAPTRFDVASGSLPTGLTLSNAGVIGGTPTAFGTFSFTVTAGNSVGTSPAKAYTITVTQAPAITTTSLPDATTNSSYTTILTATGSPAPTFAVSSGTLPTGLALSSSAGTISGTPSAAGTYTFAITANNSVGNSTPQSLTIYVAPIGTAANRVPAPVTDTVFWSKVIAGKLPGYGSTGGANTATSSGIVFQPGGNFLSVTRQNLPVPASRKVQVNYTAGGMTPFLVPKDASGNFIGSGSGDGTWYVWTSGNVTTLPANATTYEVVVPNWTGNVATLSSIQVIEQ